MVASLLKALGVPAGGAQIILGHSRLAVTLEIYTYADDEAQLDARIMPDSLWSIGWRHKMQTILRRSCGTAVAAWQGGHREAGEVVLQFVPDDADGRRDHGWCVTVFADGAEDFAEQLR